MKTIELSSGQIEYVDQGNGPVIVFVHGLLVDHQLWLPVIEHLKMTHRCIAPRLPLGSHLVPMNRNADLSPEGMAALVDEFMAALELNDVTLVGNDSGGAICQVVAARHPHRLGRIVLTNCDALEIFPPKEFEYLGIVGRLPALHYVIAKAMHAWPTLRRMKTAYGGLTVEPLSDDLLGRWVGPSADSAAIRRDSRKFMAGANKDLTLTIAKELKGFKKPALLVWGSDDPYFTVELAERLADCLPNAQLIKIDEAATFVGLDQPERVAQAIQSHATAAAAA